MSTVLAHAAPEAPPEQQDAPQPTPAAPRPRRWTRAEYYKMAEAGILGPTERVELIEGEVVAHMSPVGNPHRVAVYKTTHVLEHTFGSGFYVDREQPIVLGDGTEPQPDVWAAVGSVDDYTDDHPHASSVRLLVEVSDSTLAYDRTTKAALYAAEGIPEYWIVNLTQRLLEVRRDPHPGVGYRVLMTFLETDSVTPLHAPQAAVAVADLLPLPAPAP